MNRFSMIYGQNHQHEIDGSACVINSWTVPSFVESWLYANDIDLDCPPTVLPAPPLIPTFEMDFLPAA
jgi:hypothetical protein